MVKQVPNDNLLKLHSLNLQTTGELACSQAHLWQKNSTAALKHLLDVQTKGPSCCWHQQSMIPSPPFHILAPV
jgi:hypothetical protein